MTPEQELELIQIQARARARADAAPAPQQAAPALADRFEGRSWGQQAGDQLSEYRRVGGQVVDALGHGAARMNTGISQLAPDVGGALGKIGGMTGLSDGSPLFPDARTALTSAGAAYGWDQPAETALDKSLEIAGQSFALGPLATAGMAGPAVSATRAATQAVTPGLRPAVETAGREGMKFLAKRPAASTAVDVASGMGAGLGMEGGRELAEVFDLGETGTTALESVGGLGGGMAVLAPNAIMNTTRRTAGSLKRAVLPASEDRAARELQGAAVGAQGRGTIEGRKTLEGMAAATDTAPPGVSAARATGSDDLMSKEARVLADDPVLGRRVDRGREEAWETAADAARAAAGPRQAPGEWEATMVNSVLPPGAAPVRAGTSQEMVKQAKAAFDAAYPEFRTLPLRPDTPATVRQAVTDALDSPDLIVDPDVQTLVSNWVVRNIPGDEAFVTADGILTLREKVRKQLRAARAAAGSGRSAGQSDRAELLDAVDDALTKVLHDSIPVDKAAGLKDVDAAYRKFKVLEDAVGRGADRELTPGAMESSLRSAAGKPRLARGAEEETLALNRGGQEAARLLNDPQGAARYVQNVPFEVAKQRRANMTHALLDRATIQPRGGGEPILSGRELAKHVGNSKEALRAAGFTETDITNLERTAATISAIERVSPQAAEKLMTDSTGTMLRLIAGFGGIKALRGLGKMFGVWDKGASIRVASKGARAGEYLSDVYLRDGAARLLRDAHQPTEEGRALYKLLLTRPTDPPRQVAEARRVVRSYMLAVAAEATPDNLGDSEAPEE